MRTEPAMGSVFLAVLVTAELGAELLAGMRSENFVEQPRFARGAILRG